MEKKSKGFHPGIQAQLTFALVLLLALCLGAVWFAASNLLQPMYNRRIQRDLTQQANDFLALVEDFDGEISSWDYFSLHVNQDFLTMMNQAITEGKLNISRSCVDLFDSSLRAVTYTENIRTCLIHGSNSKLGSWLEGSRDTALALQLRQQLVEQGSLMTTLTDEKGGSQMVVGALTSDGEYGVIVSTDLTQVEVAGEVLEELLPLIAIFLLLVSCLLAALYSAWFTRPLKRLSHAARQLAQGEYDTPITIRRTDEIGVLSRDFNQMAQEVKRSSQLQRDLLANVSHDLRTPLTLIKGYAETVRDLTGDDPQRRTAQLDIIVQETDRLSGLVNSVMDLSKVTSGNEKPKLTQFDMSQLCAQVAQTYQAVCEQNGWELVVEADTPCTVTADRDMMERVLHNLLGNASHHLGEDKKFFLRVIPLAQGCRVEVEDHGPGVAAEDLPHIFDRYYRSRSDTGKVGTGLGLPITKAILQGHGFRFGVDSTLGKGTLFWFTPVREVQS